MSILPPPPAPSFRSDSGSSFRLSEAEQQLHKETDRPHESDGPDAVEEDQSRCCCCALDKKLLHTLCIAFGFCFLAGWSDTLSVIHFSTFSSMMTGNVVYLGVTLAGAAQVFHKVQPAWFYVIVIASNVSGSFLTSWLLTWHCHHFSDESLDNNDNNGDATSKSLFWKRRPGYLVGLGFCLPLFLTGSIVFQQTNGWTYSICFFAAALGAQNYFSAVQLKITTTLATGNLQKIAALSAQHMVQAKQQQQQQQQHGATLLSSSWSDVLPPLAAASGILAGALWGGGLFRLEDSGDVTSADNAVVYVSQYTIAGLQALLFVAHDEGKVRLMGRVS